MKRILILFCMSMIIFNSGCKKNNDASLDNQIKSPFIDSAAQFLKTTLSDEDYTKLDLTSTNILRHQNKNIGLEIYEKNATHDKFLLLGTNSGGYKGNWVDLAGLNKTVPKYIKGFITLKSLDKSTSTKFIVDSNKVTKIIKNASSQSPGVVGGSSENETRPEDLPEIIVVYDVNVNDSPEFFSLYWLYDEDYAYGDYYTPSGGGGTGSTGTGTVGNQTNNVAAVPTFLPPETRIPDLKEEFKCFTNTSSATYEISINVNEPYPNSRDVFNPISSEPVGHTFYTLQQHNTDGSTVIRNVGFYPRNVVKPGAAVDQSTFGDDSYTPFDVSLKVDVSWAEFNTVLNTMVNQQAYNYDLNNFNCTNSPINALKSIDISLPDTKSADILFTGNNPADLGEDIRSLNLNTFSADNGNRQFTRTVSSSNDQKPPARQGSCP